MKFFTTQGICVRAYSSPNVHNNQALQRTFNSPRISYLFRLFTRDLLGCHLTSCLVSCTFSGMVSPRKRVKVQRLDIHLDPPLLAWLRLEAKRLDVSMSEIIRRLLRKEMGV